MEIFQGKTAVFISQSLTLGGVLPLTRGQGRRMITKVIKLSTTPVIFW
ncbi:MAG UNVERIFIED_CONTAM: hypothetical protein LVR29_26440 [Microcystis novacekii LVE1205-3]